MGADVGVRGVWAECAGNEQSAFPIARSWPGARRCWRDCSFTRRAWRYQARSATNKTVGEKSLGTILSASRCSGRHATQPAVHREWQAQCPAGARRARRSSDDEIVVSDRLIHIYVDSAGLPDRLTLCIFTSDDPGPQRVASRIARVALDGVPSGSPVAAGLRHTPGRDSHPLPDEPRYERVEPGTPS